MLTEANGLTFLQLAVLLAVAQVIAFAIKRLGQPPVIAQMISGFVLGPSVLGLLAPSIQHALFPANSQVVLQQLGQVGLILYMFIVGADMDRAFLRRHIKGATAVSSAGVVLPLLAGVILALFLLRNATLFPSGVADWVRIAFFATAIAVTAFPVMARIIDEQGLSGSRVANVALAAGAVSDVVAWGLLAIILAAAASRIGGIALTLAGGVMIAVAILFGVRPLLKRLLPRRLDAATIDTRALAFILLLLMLSAWGTSYTGLHPAFGAFLLGIAMPRSQLTEHIGARISPIALNLFLPIFFIYAGLNTQIGLVDTPYLVFLTVAVIAVACLGKGVACWLAAMVAGYPPRDALAVGILMNARGLVSLIILTSALEHRIITPTLFSIMVVMTIVTTLMAAPVLRILYRRVDPAKATAIQGSDAAEVGG